MSLVEAVESGDELVALEALRNALAVQLESCDSGRDYASLSLRLMGALNRISEIKGKKPSAVSPLDEIASRRARKKPVRGGVKREA